MIIKELIMSTKKAIFLCTGNSAVNQMTERLQHASAEVFSADTEKNYPVVLLKAEIPERWQVDDHAKLYKEDDFSSTQHIIEERLRLWLAEG
jgi:protein-tyrosine-phosphatase